MENITVEQLIDALIAFENVLTPEMPNDVPAFARARVVMAKALNSFIADEGEQVTLLRRFGCSNAPQRQQQEIYKAIVDVRIRYSGHITKWTAAKVAADWRQYRSESVSLIVAMRNLLIVRAALRALETA